MRTKRVDLEREGARVGVVIEFDSEVEAAEFHDGLVEDARSGGVRLTLTVDILAPEPT